MKLFSFSCLNFLIELFLLYIRNCSSIAKDLVTGGDFFDIWSTLSSGPTFSVCSMLSAFWLLDGVLPVVFPLILAE